MRNFLKQFSFFAGNPHQGVKAKVHQEVGRLKKYNNNIFRV